MADIPSNAQIPEHPLRSFFISLLVLLCLLAFPKFVSAQTASKKALKLFDNAREQIDKGDYDKAESSLKAAIKDSPEFKEALIYLADLSSVTGQTSDAKSYYDKVIALDPDIGRGIHYKLAKACIRLEDFDSAVHALESYLNTSGLSDENRSIAVKMLTQSRYSAEAVKNPVPFDPVNLGPLVNDKDPAYLPSISADESILIYTKRVDNKAEDFFISYNIDGTWSEAKNLGPPVNTSYNEGAQNISADGQWLFYTGCNFPGGFGSCDIYVSRKDGDEWTRPENLGNLVNTSAWESQPSVSANGKHLYFVSNRQGGFGDMDLWVSKLGSDGRWQQAANLGEVINTPLKEQSPFIHADGQTLYFSSEGHPGMGDFDLYLSRRGIDLRWQEPENLGYPINTTANDGTLVVSADGSTAYFSSSRKDTYGSLDIYSFEMPESIKPKPVNIVKARVLDKDTKTPVHAFVELIDLNSGEILNRASNNTISGEFITCLPLGKEYALNISSTGYLFHSENFSLKDTKNNELVSFDVLLNPVRIGEKIRLNNIFYQSGSWELEARSALELDKLVDLLQKNPTLSIRVNGHTDDVGNVNDNLILSEKRAISVAEYLKSKGLNEEQIDSKGYGESDPISENDTEKGRALNRRTEIEVVDL